MIDGNLQVVGHVSRKISSICSIFIRRGGKIICRITGHRRYLSDLPQGGPELPCILTFTTASAKECSKTKKIFESTLSVETREAQSVDKSVEYSIHFHATAVAWSKKVRMKR